MTPQPSEQPRTAVMMLRRLVTEGRSARDTRDFYGNDGLVIAAFDRRTWKEAIALVDGEAAAPDPAASPAPLDAAELAKLIGQAMYGWGDDEPNEATGYLLRAEAETVARHLLREGWQPPPRLGQPVAEEPEG